ncbi:hypothetical protein [Sphingobium sp. Leaf26]|uniref:hypothetical protein n=1 Tax=Sphingobium sp. Leaf26 TaxID=1735693 RepID=UPI0012E141C0|nr:hypothetical protein [Sphingobium sp. Leaf26]
MATTRLAGCDAGHYCVNGTGNNLLGIVPTDWRRQAWEDVTAAITSENTHFWKHLALADLIGGIDPGAGVPDWGKTHLGSSLGGGFHVRSSMAFLPIYGTLNGITMVLRNDITGGWRCDDPGRDNCAVSSHTAERIDKKMDDGVALSGTVQAISSGWTNGCGRGDLGINSASGYGANNLKSCDIMFKVDN